MHKQTRAERHGMRIIAAAATTSRGRIRIEAAAKRVRAYLGGTVVADTARPVLVWEVPYSPAYYFPVVDVRAELLEADGGVTHTRSRGDGHTLTVRAGTKEMPRAALRYEHSPIDELRDLIWLDGNAMDARYEEDEQVFTHPRDPYTRVHILPGSRHVRVESEGVTIAESTSQRLLVETGLPARLHTQDPRSARRVDPGRHGDPLPVQGPGRTWSVRAGDTLHEDLACSHRTRCPRARRSPG
jgi:uncharacterized protein (DUF427 family)